MPRSNPLRVLALTALACLAVTGARAAEPKDLALLVGCTRYPNYPGVRELFGPANDIPKWATLLTDPQGFAFPKNGVIELVGWSDTDEATRPTYANIVRGFESLIAKAGPDSRVVIVLSGHGVQIPIPEDQDPLDPKNPEPDGMDEVFLPADVNEVSGAGVGNILTDNQIGGWLNQLRDKGAHVLLVVDSCHSGTMTRGDTREIDRLVNPSDLKIPAKTIRDAVERARKAVAEATAAGRRVSEENMFQPSRSDARGSLVAFYAAQAFETAPELPFPAGAPRVPENYYGMLSFSLIKTITSRKTPLSYGELSRLLSAEYRSVRGARQPTPFAEGDLHRQVLGLNAWPTRPVVLIQRGTKNQLTLNAGTLHGLTKGSILAIHPPVTDSRDPKMVLGYIVIDSAEPSTAVVLTTTLSAESAQPAIAADQVPDLAVAELVRRNVGDLGVKLFVAKSIQPSFDKLSAATRDMVLLTSEEEADWVLRTVSPIQAKSEYGIDGVTHEMVFLISGEGRTHDASNSDPAFDSDERPRFPRVFGQYSPQNEPAIIGGLERDLPKIFKWENLWRIARGAGTANGDESHGLIVEVVRFRDENDRDGEVVRSGVLKDRDRVLFRGRNDGPEALWVTAFYLDANLRIQILRSDGVGRGKSVTFARARMNVADNSIGQEGLAVFAIPMSVQKEQPDFAILEQEPLQVAEVIKRDVTLAPKGPQTPFSKLLRQAALNSGTRGLDVDTPTTPAIVVQSWRLVP
jgi:hypothetical protein